MEFLITHNVDAPMRLPSEPNHEGVPQLKPIQNEEISRARPLHSLQVW
jgi:hypothetical protein